MWLRDISYANNPSHATRDNNGQFGKPCRRSKVEIIFLDASCFISSIRLLTLSIAKSGLNSPLVHSWTELTWWMSHFILSQCLLVSTLLDFYSILAGWWGPDFGKFYQLWSCMFSAVAIEGLCIEKMILYLYLGIAPLSEHDLLRMKITINWMSWSSTKFSILSFSN